MASVLSTHPVLNPWHLKREGKVKEMSSLSQTCVWIHFIVKEKWVGVPGDDTITANLKENAL